MLAATRQTIYNRDTNQDAQISGNHSSIATNATNIAANTAAIAQLQSDQSGEESANGHDLRLSTLEALSGGQTNDGTTHTHGRRLVGKQEVRAEGFAHSTEAKLVAKASSSANASLILERGTTGNDYVRFENNDDGDFYVRSKNGGSENVLIEATKSSGSIDLGNGNATVRMKTNVLSVQPTSGWGKLSIRGNNFSDALHVSHDSTHSKVSVSTSGGEIESFKIARSTGFTNFSKSIICNDDAYFNQSARFDTTVYLDAIQKNSGGNATLFNSLGSSSILKLGSSLSESQFLSTNVIFDGTIDVKANATFQKSTGDLLILNKHTGTTDAIEHRNRFGASSDVGWDVSIESSTSDYVISRVSGGTATPALSIDSNGNTRFSGLECRVKGGTESKPLLALTEQVTNYATIFGGCLRYHGVDNKLQLCTYNGSVNLQTPSHIPFEIDRNGLSVDIFPNTSSGVLTLGSQTVANNIKATTLSVDPSTSVDALFTVLSDSTHNSRVALSNDDYNGFFLTSTSAGNFELGRKNASSTEQTIISIPRVSDGFMNVKCRLNIEEVGNNSSSVWVQATEIYHSSALFLRNAATHGFQFLSESTSGSVGSLKLRRQQAGTLYTALNIDRQTGQVTINSESPTLNNYVALHVESSSKLVRLPELTDSNMSTACTSGLQGSIGYNTGSNRLVLRNNTTTPAVIADSSNKVTAYVNINDLSSYKDSVYTGFTGSTSTWTVFPGTYAPSLTVTNCQANDKLVVSGVVLEDFSSYGLLPDFWRITVRRGGFNSSVITNWTSQVFSSAGGDNATEVASLTFPTRSFKLTQADIDASTSIWIGVEMMRRTTSANVNLFAETASGVSCTQGSSLHCQHLRQCILPTL